MVSSWLQKMRIKAVLPYLKGRILDYGCGSGTLAKICPVASYYGVDIDEDSLKAARLKYPNFRFEKIIPENEKFDTAVLLAVVEHIDDPGSLLAHINGRLNPGGRIVLTTPNPLFKICYRLGSKLGVFSSQAEVEHKKLINYQVMDKIAFASGLFIDHFRYFMFGANQLFILGARVKK